MHKNRVLLASMVSKSLADSLSVYQSCMEKEEKKKNPPGGTLYQPGTEHRWGKMTEKDKSYQKAAVTDTEPPLFL